MRIFRTCLILISLVLTCGVGCNTSSDTLVVGRLPTSIGDEPLVWIEREYKHESTTISLGYRKGKSHADGLLEPVAMLTRDGEFATDAMVFHCVVDTDGKKTISEEVATMYENKEGEVAGLYTQGKHKSPQDASNFIVRFRIVLADVPEPVIRDVKIP